VFQKAETPRISRQSALEGGKVVSHTQRPSLPPGTAWEYSGLSKFIYVYPQNSTLNIFIKLFSTFWRSYEWKIKVKLTGAGRKGIWGKAVKRHSFRTSPTDRRERQVSSFRGRIVVPIV
jgi:hypothetical protein